MTKLRKSDHPLLHDEKFDIKKMVEELLEDSKTVYVADYVDAKYCKNHKS